MTSQNERHCLVEQLSEFGVVELLSVKTHLALFITGKNLGSLKTVNSIIDLITTNNLTKEYPLIQSIKNDDTFFIVTMNKESN